MIQFQKPCHVVGFGYMPPVFRKPAFEFFIQRRHIFRSFFKQIQKSEGYNGFFIAPISTDFSGIVLTLTPIIRCHTAIIFPENGSSFNSEYQFSMR